MSNTEDSRRELRRAVTVASRVDLEEISMLAFSGQVEDRDIDELRPEVFTRSGFGFDEATSRLVVEVEAIVNVTRGVCDRPATEASPDVPVLVVTKHRLVYRLRSEPPPEEARDDFFEAFARVNAVYNAWPYIREAVQSFSTRLGVSPILLPLYRLPGAADHTGESGGDRPMEPKSVGNG